MSNFEFVFSLLSLMLGLSLANVLGGLGDALQERRKLHVGVLTPLLALLITIDIASCWTVAWSLRDLIQPTFFSLLCGLAVTGTYYFISRMVVPRNTAEWPNFDDYYWSHKRWILGGQIFCDASAYAAQMALHEQPLAGIFDKVFAGLLFVAVRSVVGEGEAPQHSHACWTNLVLLSRRRSGFSVLYRLRARERSLNLQAV